MHISKHLLMICLLIFISSCSNNSDFMIKVYETSREGNKLTEQTDFEIGDSVSIIKINTNKKYQTITGFGGAFTESSAYLLNQMSDAKRKEIIDAYFSENGSNYSLTRTHMNSCDFSLSNYSYSPIENDKELKHFSVKEDMDDIIPMIKDAQEASKDGFKIFASPWTASPWMKDNNDWRGGKLLPEYYESWALYYTRFIKAYEAEGMPIWGITIQNEPMAVQRWESCIYTAEEERDFLKNHLGPTMEREGLGDKKIVVWDHNRDLISNRANTIFDDPEASKYAWGIGIHWYERWAGGKSMFDNLKNVTESYPDKKLLFTEGCIEAFDAEKYQFWPNAERYGSSMINDFNSGTVGWTDWNILLDQNGGPNHVGNYCFAPIHADINTKEVVMTPSYYYIGHFSKFIKPGAKRISTVSSRSHLLSTSFMNEDGSIATVVMNETDQDINYKMYIGMKGLEQFIPAHSIQTIVY